jgi:integrase
MTGPSKPRSGWPAADKLSRHFAAVADARTLVKDHAEVTPTTAKEYARKARHLALLSERERQHHPGQAFPLARVLAGYAPVSATFFKYKAAVIHHYVGKIREALREQDQVQRNGDFSEWCRQLHRLATLCAQLRRVQGLQRKHLLAQTGQSSAKLKTKRYAVRRMPANWRTTVVDQARADKKHYLPVLALSLTGCRPSEVGGMALRYESGQVLIKINGRKVTDKNGQPTREFSIDAAQVPIDLLRILSSLPSVTLNDLTTEAQRDTFRMYLKRLGRNLWPESNVTLSPILFRHQMATDLVRSGWEKQDIAAVLGHASANTQGRYGARSKTTAVRPSGIDPRSIKTARSIRPAKSSAFNRPNPPHLKHTRRQNAKGHPKRQGGGAAVVRP